MPAAALRQAVAADRNFLAALLDYAGGYCAMPDA
jgi:hypothetical protein